MFMVCPFRGHISAGAFLPFSGGENHSLLKDEPFAQQASSTLMAEKSLLANGRTLFLMEKR
jgi:hypothetical protein